MKQKNIQFVDLFRLLCLSGMFVLPMQAMAQVPGSIRLGQSISIESIKPEFSATAVVSLGVRAIEPAMSFGRSSAGIEMALRPITGKFSSSVVEIRNEQNELVSLGTVVAKDGLVVCKHSELPEKFFCVLPDDSKYWGRLIGVHPKKDLALVHIAADHLQPIVFSDTEAVPPGRIVVSIGPGGEPAGFGLVSLPQHDFGLKQTECPDCVDLGITVSAVPIVAENNSESEPSTGLDVVRVYPRSTAESCGLLVGDLLQSINGIELKDREHLHSIARSIKIGQVLNLRIIRDGNQVLLSTKIKNFASPTLHDRWGGGPFSKRRFGFSSIIAHDSVVLPEHCGSPLVDLDGRVIGINIARSMRVATFSIPIQDVLTFVKLVRPNANLQLESVEMPESSLSVSTE